MSSRASNYYYRRSDRGPPSKFKLQRERIYEEYAYVLDVIPYGRGGRDRTRPPSPTAQVIGEKYFTLLEVQLRPEAVVDLGERLYIGKDGRDKVLRVTGRIEFKDLTASAKAELETLLERIVSIQEARFLEFFNRSSAVTPRMHALELIPGIGKKSMWQIIREREKKPFSSFIDLKERGGVSDPHKLVAKRILEEISGSSKYKVFTRS
jgi:putative nucleotide binding protein